MMPTTTVQPEPATGHSGRETEVGSLFVANYPPFSAWSAEALPEFLAAVGKPPRAGAELGLYLHIPFCRKRCKFCYFRVYTDKSFDEIGAYLEALATEVEIYAATPAVAGRRPKFVYFGGGTPSYISVKHLEALAERLEKAMPWQGAEEVTFECEPGTLSESKVRAIKGIGVTRLSLGIESFDDELLRANGRAHTTKEIDRCLPWVEAAGFDQVNVDLIAGLVGESWESWRRSVERTVALAPDSVTVYQLELPFNTRFARSHLAGELGAPLADWETKRAWHDHAFDRLAGAGYELSSAYTMTKKGRPCRFVYRDAVWHGCDLVGTGVASFGHLSGVHVQNVDGWGEYVGRLAAARAGANGDPPGPGTLPLGRAFRTSTDDRLTRETLLQLKLGRIEAAPFREKFGVDILERFAAPFDRLEERGMLRREEDAVALTRRGLLQVDTLLPELYEARYRGARYT